MAQPIKIVRGTTNTFSIDVTDADGNPYTLGSGEKLVFGVVELGGTAPLFTREATADDTGGYVVTITPADTAQLRPDRYFYDVGLQSGGNFYNVVEYSPIDIIPNATVAGVVT